MKKIAAAYNGVKHSLFIAGKNGEHDLGYKNSLKKNLKHLIIYQNPNY